MGIHPSCIHSNCLHCTTIVSISHFCCWCCLHYKGYCCCYSFFYRCRYSTHLRYSKCRYCYSCYRTSSGKATTTTANTKDYAVSSSLGISTKGKGSCTISSSLCATYIYPRTTILFLPLVSSVAKGSSSSKGYRCSLAHTLALWLCSNTKRSRYYRSRTQFYRIACPSTIQSIYS